MPDVIQEDQADIIVGTLGPDNRGSIGPRTEREAEFALDFAQERYLRPVTSGSHCVDDRCRGWGVRLAGNRAHTEVAGSLMDPEVKARPASKIYTTTIKDLLALGQPPYFHAGCAASLFLTSGDALRYFAENPDSVIRPAMDRLRLVGIDTVSENQMLEAAAMAGDRASDPRLLDVTPEEILELAERLGAPRDHFAGEHSAAGTGWLMRAATHDNGLFRDEHIGDSQQLVGMFTVTPGAHLAHLEHERRPRAEIDKRMMHAVIFAVSVLKLAESENAPDVIVV